MNLPILSRYYIILKLYYPFYTSPPESRFTSMFSSLNFKQKNIKKTSVIYPNRIISGEDKRTSILIKNLPPNMTQKKLEKIVSQYGNINFCYVPCNGKSNEYKYGFVNTINYRTVAEIFMGIRKFNFDFKNISHPEVKVSYCSIQSRKSLIEKFYLNKK